MINFVQIINGENESKNLHWFLPIYVWIKKWSLRGPQRSNTYYQWYNGHFLITIFSEKNYLFSPYMRVLNFDWILQNFEHYFLFVFIITFFECFEILPEHDRVICFDFPMKERKFCWISVNRCQFEDLNLPTLEEYYMVEVKQDRIESGRGKSKLYPPPLGLRVVLIHSCQITNIQLISFRSWKIFIPL